MQTVGLIARVVLMPFAVAFTTAWGCRLALGGRIARWGPVIGFAAGYLAAFAFVDRHEWLPDRHWHWLPYATLAAAVVGAVATRLQTRVTAVITIALCGMAGWWMVPKWMEPPGLQISLLGIYLCGLMALHGLLWERIDTAKARIFLLTTSLAVAAMTASLVSASYGRLAAIPAAALGGIVLANYGRASDTLGGLLPAWVMSTAGVAYIGCVEPQEPLWGLLLAPAAPLWISATFIGPVSRLSGVRKTLAQCGCLLAGFAAAVLVTLAM